MNQQHYEQVLQAVGALNSKIDTIQAGLNSRFDSIERRLTNIEVAFARKTGFPVPRNPLPPGHVVDQPGPLDRPAPRFVAQGPRAGSDEHFVLLTLGPILAPGYPLVHGMRFVGDIHYNVGKSQQEGLGIDSGATNLALAIESIAKQYQTNQAVGTRRLW
jgi:hypothetical protein